MNFAIRAFASDDAGACTEIFERAWHAGHLYAPRLVDAAFANDTKDEAVLVAESAPGTVVGFVSIHEPESFIHDLYVDPAVDGCGLGHALLAAAVRFTGGRATLGVSCAIRT